MGIVKDVVTLGLKRGRRLNAQCADKGWVKTGKWAYVVFKIKDQIRFCLQRLNLGNLSTERLCSLR